MPTSRLDIDLSAIERNLSGVRDVIGGSSPMAHGPAADARPGAGPQAPGPGPRPTPGSPRVGVCAVLKQDAYGCGAVRVAKRLSGLGVDMLAVYTLDEARPIAEAVPALPILVLMPVHGVDRTDPLYRHAAAGRLHLALHSADQFQGVQEMAGRIGAPVPVHVQVDTGLTRGGVLPDQAAALVGQVVASPRIRLGGLMTHFSSPCCDDGFTREQARVFREFVEAIKPAVKAAVEQGGKAVSNVAQMSLHAANSCAMFRSRAYHGTMVRVGQAVLGYCGHDVPGRERFEFRDEMERLEPAVRWLSSVVHVQEIDAGWPVGYGSTWRAPARADGRRTRIALIPVGYADGYPRTLGGRGNGGPGWVGFTGRLFERRGGGEGPADEAGRAPDGTQNLPMVYAPVVGRVSMDQITVDVTDVPDAYLRTGKVGAEPVGPEVELYSRSPGTRNFLPALADAAGSITHELLCRIGPRVERTYRVPAAMGGADGAATAVRIGGVKMAGVA